MYLSLVRRFPSHFPAWSARRCGRRPVVIYPRPPRCLRRFIWVWWWLGEGGGGKGNGLGGGRGLAACLRRRSHAVSSQSRLRDQTPTLITGDLATCISLSRAGARPGSFCLCLGGKTWTLSLSVSQSDFFGKAGINTGRFCRRISDRFLLWPSRPGLETTPLFPVACTAHCSCVLETDRGLRWRCGGRVLVFISWPLISPLTFRSTPTSHIPAHSFFCVLFSRGAMVARPTHDSSWSARKYHPGEIHHIRGENYHTRAALRVVVITASGVCCRGLDRGPHSFRPPRRPASSRCILLRIILISYAPVDLSNSGIETI